MIRAAVVIALVAGTAAAQGQNIVCRDRAGLVAQLASKYGESLRSVGLRAGGKQIIETYASETGSWTIIVTDPSGRACLLAAGEAFALVAPEDKGEPL